MKVLQESTETSTSQPFSAVPANSPGQAAPSGSRRPLVNGMRWWIPWLFIAPTIFFVVTLLIVPVVGGLLVAFTEWNVVSGLSGIRWVGLANFAELLGDDMFWSSTARTIFYTATGTPLTIALGMVLALALNRPQPGRAALRVIFYLPSLVNAIAAGTVWLLLLNPESGLVNQGLGALGLTDLPGWFTSQEWALPALVLMSIWSGAGYVCVIYLAALQDMPHELYESAMIDGAGALRRFTTITWPGLVPVTTFLLITSFIGRSQGFGLIAFMTSGGPGSSTTVLSYYMYEMGFHAYRFGYAAAIGVMSMFGVFLLSLALWKLQRNRGLYT